jgi:hypothetical protein
LDPRRAIVLEKEPAFTMFPIRLCLLGRSVTYPVALGGNSAFMERYMRVVILAAAVAVASMSFACAAEVKKDTAKAPVVFGKAMTDTDMDRVTAAGAYIHTNSGYVYPNWSETGQINASHGFRGQNGNAARCPSCGI